MPASEEATVRLTRLGLEGDGVNRQLFELLWKRDLHSDQSVALRIPDTIVFKFNYPSVWYFTSVDGTLKRKHKSKLNDEYILQEFLKRPPQCGICAYYVRTVVDAEDAHKGLAENVPAPTTIEYLNEAQLQDFLFNRQREKGSGLLQKFLEPFGDRNNMIRALWSPKVCLLERRLNCLNLNDTRYDMYERAVTFEGPDFHSEVTPVRGSTLANKVLQIAETIVQHVKGATNDRVNITRLALNFKVDHKDQLYFLFASSVRLTAPAGAQPLEVNTKLQVPENIHRAQSVSRVAPAILLRSCSCPTCQEKVHEEMLFDVSYKVIMEYEEQRLSAAKTTLLPEAGNSPKVQEVPEALQRLHPRLQGAEFSTLKNELAFQEKCAAVCENCYLRFSTAQLGPVQRLAAPELRTAMEEALGDAEAALVGTGALAPERLALRREVTRRKILNRKEMEDGLFEMAEPRAPLRKASSCPKLPTWGPDHQGYPLWGPTPLLRRPPPPKGAPPSAARLREAFAEAPVREKSRSKVPQLNGDPYLRAIQDFASSHHRRAAEVLGPRAGEKLAALARKGAKAPPAEDVLARVPSDEEQVVHEQVRKYVSRHSSAISTPTTRPPSHLDGNGSAPSSNPTSRPSTRPSSRGFVGRSSRPSSSPSVGFGSRGGKPRPASSPMLRGQSWREVLRAASAEKMPAPEQTTEASGEEFD